MPAKKLPLLSVGEYLKYEESIGLRCEYHAGKVYSLAGGSIEHALLIGNAYAEIRGALRSKSKPCKPIASEAKLALDTHNKFLYPDGMVFCEDLERSKLLDEALVNPTLILEVLSKSTADYDRGDKFHFYRQIASLREYMLIDQYQYVVEVYYRQEKNGLWEITRYEGFEDTVLLQSLDIVIKMEELYFDIKLASR